MKLETEFCLFCLDLRVEGSLTTVAQWGFPIRKPYKIRFYDTIMEDDIDICVDAFVETF